MWTRHRPCRVVGSVRAPPRVRATGVAAGGKRVPRQAESRVVAGLAGNVEPGHLLVVDTGLQRGQSSGGRSAAVLGHGPRLGVGRLESDPNRWGDRGGVRDTRQLRARGSAESWMQRVSAGDHPCHTRWRNWSRGSPPLLGLAAVGTSVPPVFDGIVTTALEVPRDLGPPLAVHAHEVFNVLPFLWGDGGMIEAGLEILVVAFSALLRGPGAEHLGNINPTNRLGVFYQF